MKGILRHCRSRSAGATRLAVLWLVLVSAGAAFGQTDPLPSWNDGPSKQAIVKLVEAVTTQGGPQYVAPAERIAVFDNDGTLWSEQPMYFQGFFAFDRMKALAPKHPEWKTKQPFKGILENNMKAVARGRREGTHGGGRGHTRRDHDRRVHPAREGLDREGEAPSIPAGLHGARLPADAGAPDVPPRQWLTRIRDKC